MKISLWCVGKPHEAFVKAGVDDYTRRLANYYPVEWNIISPPKVAASLSETELKKREGETVLAALKPDDWLVALDERGKQLSTEGLADLLQKRSNESTKRLLFLIGGAYGLDAAVLHRAAFTWSLSLLTFPHQLVRLILAEQVYRACTILRNEKYHHR